MNFLTVPRTRLGPLLRAARGQSQPIRCPVGVSRWDGHQELLMTAPGAAAVRHLLLAVSDDFTPPRDLPPDCAGVLTLGAGGRRGEARAWVHRPPELTPIGRLKLVGPGMHVVALRPALAQSGEPAVEPALRERWSRTIAALGEEVWRRLTGWHYGVVGVGRSGSLLASALAAGWGVERLTLIDPDRVERHNLGETAGVTDGDLGEMKAEVLARRLRSPRLARPAVATVSSSITHLPALRAAQACDVLFGCVDHDGARLALAALAVLFHKPYVDIATGIHGAGDRRHMGADVRLMVPGEQCVLCQGLADPAGARRLLASADAEQSVYQGRDWRQERAGSLRSLNQFAVALGLRLWEDFMAERVMGSTWMHMEYDRAGRLNVVYPSLTPRGPCPLCSLLGLGEEGVYQVGALLQEDPAAPPSP